MVGMATRASNNHISRTGIGGTGKHKLSAVTVVRTLSVNEDKSYTGAAGKISDHWRSNCFLKIDTEGDKTRCVGSLFQKFTARTEKAPLLRRRWHGPCSPSCVSSYGHAIIPALLISTSTFLPGWQTLWTNSLIDFIDWRSSCSINNWRQIMHGV